MATNPARKKAAPTNKQKPAAPKKVPAGSVTPGRKAPTTKNPPPAKPPPKAKKAAPKPAKEPKPAAPVEAATKELAPRALRFVDEYLIDLNATQAAIRAGYSAKTAQEQSSRLLSNVMVQAAVSAARKAQQERTQITADAMLQQAWAIATADARELIETRVGCCRYCWGEGFRYQRTVSEMNLARESWLNEGKAPEEFEEQGGIGYNPHRPPHPEHCY